MAFAETAKEVVGVDLSDAMLRIARRKNRFSNVTFRQADAVDLPFGNGTFDAACISFALHEMPSSVRERVVGEIARVTRPGGRIVIVDYALPRNPIASSLAYHVIKLYERDSYAKFVKSDLEALVKSAGIEPSGRRPALGGIAAIFTGRRAESMPDARVREGPSAGEAHAGA